MRPHASACAACAPMHVPNACQIHTCNIQVALVGGGITAAGAVLILGLISLDCVFNRSATSTAAQLLLVTPVATACDNGALQRTSFATKFARRRSHTSPLAAPQPRPSNQLAPGPLSPRRRGSGEAYYSGQPQQQAWGA